MSDEKQNTARRLTLMWLNEIQNEDIERIDPELLKEIDLYIEKSKQKLQTETSLQKDVLKREIEIIQFILKDILKIRLEKVINSALGLLEIDLRKALPHEKRIYTHLRELIKRTLETPQLEKATYFQEEKLDLLATSDLSLLPTSETKYCILISYEKIPRFLGIDGIIYRDIEMGDIVCMPDENFRLFKKTRLKKIF